MDQAEPEVVVGVIVAPFGIKGEVKVRLETDFPERYTRMKSVYVKLPSGSSEVKKIESVRFHKGMALIKFAGCSDMDSAEKLRGGELRVHLQELVKLPEGQYYVHDIIGMKVVTEDGVDLGEVTEVLMSAGNDVYVTKKVMIPAAREFIKEVDTEGRRIVVSRLEDLEAEEE